MRGGPWIRYLLVYLLGVKCYGLDLYKQNKLICYCHLGSAVHWLGARRAALWVHQDAPSAQTIQKLGREGETNTIYFTLRLLLFQQSGFGIAHFMPNTVYQPFKCPDANSCLTRTKRPTGVPSRTRWRPFCHGAGSSRGVERVTPPAFTTAHDGYLYPVRWSKKWCISVMDAFIIYYFVSHFCLYIFIFLFLGVP